MTIEREQVHRVVLDVAADAHDLGEDEVEDAEQEQRPHQRPHVAERRAEEAQLEVGDREHPGEAAEAAQVVADGGRPAVARRGGLSAHERSTSSCVGRSATPPVMPRALHDQRLARPRGASSQRGGPASHPLTAGRERVAARREPVLEREPHDQRARPPRTGRSGPCGDARGDEDRVPHLVAERDGEHRDLHGLAELDLDADGARLALARQVTMRSPAASSHHDPARCATSPPVRLRGARPSGACCPKLTSWYCRATLARAGRCASTRPARCSIARSQKRSTAAMSWVTKRIVLPSARMRSNSSKHLRWNDGVAHREHLVDEQHVGVDLDRDREAEPDAHPRRVVLQLQVDELLELGERDDLVEALVRLLARRARA